MTTSQPIDASIEERFAEQQARLAAMSFTHALAVGDRAADFELPNAHGRRIRLADQLERGPVVLTFYSGVWCPFCNLQLRSFQQALPQAARGSGSVSRLPRFDSVDRARRFARRSVSI